MNIYDLIFAAKFESTITCAFDKQHETIQRMGYTYLATDSLGNCLYQTKKRYALITAEPNNAIKIYKK